MFIPENEHLFVRFEQCDYRCGFSLEQEETQRFSGILKLIADDTEIVAINRIALENI